MLIPLILLILMTTSTDINQTKPSSGRVAWRAPSNIAFVKYWGKRDRQIPTNPSLSMTLKNCYSQMKVEFNFDPSQKMQVEVLFEGKSNDKFQSRIAKYLESICLELPFVSHLSLKIDSMNSFPHSAGIASSASSMAALALTLCSIEEHIYGKKSEREEFFQRASYLARLASGSACRSLYPNYALWGQSLHFQDGCNEYAIGDIGEISKEFKEVCDAILLVDSSVKDVSSSAGHQLMNDHPMAQNKYLLSDANTLSVLKALREGDWALFGEVLESEALSLHAMMMTSNPSFILLKPNSLAIIEKVKRYRLEKDLPLFFTIDAGPNIHLIYPKTIQVDVEEFIENQLKDLLEEGKWIQDMIGSGPEEIEFDS